MKHYIIILMLLTACGICEDKNFSMQIEGMDVSALEKLLGFYMFEQPDEIKRDFIARRAAEKNSFLGMQTLLQILEGRESQKLEFDYWRRRILKHKVPAFDHALGTINKETSMRKCLTLVYGDDIVNPSPIIAQRISKIIFQNERGDRVSDTLYWDSDGFLTGILREFGDLNRLFMGIKIFGDGQSMAAEVTAITGKRVPVDEWQAVVHGMKPVKDGIAQPVKRQGQGQ